MKIQEAHRDNVQISKCSSRATEASTVHTSPRVHADMPANVGNPARCAKKYQQNQQKHATAFVDGVRGTLRHVSKERSDEKRPQDPESTPSSRKLYKFFQKPTWMMQNMYP